ncbi:MAG: T9SS type A sorting domain-containing protein [Bacteroidetes bacterium]|nr:T9SS type A sorting domain-containing protein [Bacteroidota bacterium]
MKKTTFTIGFWVLFFFLGFMTFAQTTKKIELPLNYKVDTRIDNMGYWQRMAAAGLVPVQPYTKIPAAKFTGTKVYNSRGVLIDDSPDVRVNGADTTTESENSIFVDPNNKMHIINSNNSTPQPSNGSVYGADWYSSSDGGGTFGGSGRGAGGSNSGDPAACINMTGRYFVGAISNSNGQEVSYSDDQGATWHYVVAGTGTMLDMCDKNHLWVDNGPASPFNGYLYNGWMKSNQIQIVVSSTNGTSWSAPLAISQGTSAGSHNQGVNFKTGTNGEAYAAWSVYDSWPSDEKAIGFSKSLDGGTTWSTAVRIINNIKGIRTHGVTQNMRVNSFPSMACDLSNSQYSGTLYIVWSNIGEPGVNTGSTSDVYMIKSSDGGATWSTPMRINQNVPDNKNHYLPWITVDQANGIVSVVFYDARNVSSTQCETYMAYSLDGGTTWTDMKVSDVSFTPSPIPNMASQYMGDYLAISAYGGKTYPSWTDTRLGHCMTWVSPIDLIIPQGHVYYDSNLVNDTTYGNGNGRLDNGETALLDLSLNCQGTAAEDSVWATLSSSSPWVTITDSTEFYGDFAIGQSKMILNGYTFHVSDSVPGLIELPFEIRAVDKIDSVSVSTFTIQTHGPAITILQHSVSDPAGNNNGRLDPGESAILYIDTKNTGDVIALNAVSELSTTNPYVTILDPSFSLGDLLPGQTATAIFHVTVSSAAYIGSAARFHNYAHAQVQFDNVYFTEKIGLIIEDWETGNFNKFAWQFTGQAPWTIDPVVKWEKLYSARSGVIGDNDTTGLYLNYNVLYDDSISFHRLDSSQLFQDRLKFFIDDAMVGQWDGRTPWGLNVYPVTAGLHTFKWLYVKNQSGSSAPDAAWVDFIVFPPEYKLAITAGENAAICAGQTYQLNGMGLNYDSVNWTTAGTGTFSDPHILNPVYTPGTADITAGSVVLTLHGYAQNMPDTASSLTLTINPATTATAGAGGEICAGNTFPVTGSTATNYSAILWTTSGDGTFSDATNLNPVYTPGVTDLVNKTATLTLTAESATQCPSASSSLALIIHPNPVVDLGRDSTMCADLSISLNATIDSAASYLWTPTNQTTAEIVVDSAGIGIGSRTFHVLITDIHGCTASDSVKVTFKLCGGIQEIPGFSFRIYPNPGNGLFSMEMAAGKEIRINIRITSPNGENVYSLNNLDVKGTITRQIDLTRMSQGNYVFELSSGSGKLTRKLIIQK